MLYNRAGRSIHDHNTNRRGQTEARRLKVRLRVDTQAFRRTGNRGRVLSPLLSHFAQQTLYFSQRCFQLLGERRTWKPKDGLSSRIKAARVIGVAPNRATGANCSGHAMKLDAQKNYIFCVEESVVGTRCVPHTCVCVCVVCMTNMHMQNNLKGVQVGGVRGWGVVA